ncbi:hypothetical protein B0T24DRAFT_706890 [Lasiosphaeria ovina]|uniref:Uncharacterized protein n=1 Tax=Lasiosphaeria ovina TaxID=92902 RepID=A0AAE0K7V6_9PEZI|nr:hypothetical protein B0T24DRAFT_706890 [Lasiosphaeria ovina]
MVRINAGEEPEIEDSDIHEFDENLEAALGQVTNAEAAATAKAAGADAGGEANIKRERNDMDSYKGLVKTTQYDKADKAFYQAAVDKSPKMQAHFANSSDPVYMITGRKVLTNNSSYEFNRNKKTDGVVGVFMNLPSVLSLGGKAGGSKGATTFQKADGVTGEHLLAVRITKLRYRPKVLGIIGAKVLTSELMMAGELADADDEGAIEYVVEIVDE